MGTRPEAIKMIPLIKVLNETHTFDVSVCCSGQHTDLIAPLWSSYSIDVHFNLKLNRQTAGLNGLMSELLPKLDSVIDQVNPDLLLIHGDTTTALAAAIAAFHRKVKIAHVESGLRSHNLASPFPEEANRKIIDSISNINFAPTTLNQDFLIKENISKKQIFITGNTGIDMLNLIIEKNAQLDEIIVSDIENKHVTVNKNENNILFTIHRRENFGERLQAVILAINEISTKFPNSKIFIPVHPNPNVRSQIYDKLFGIDNIFLLRPVEYEEFIVLMSMAKIIYTDSGGIQEEAPSLGIPVLILRENTERPEGLNAGVSHLIGTDTKAMVDSYSNFYQKNEYQNQQCTVVNPYGDGSASLKIRDVLIGILT